MACPQRGGIQVEEDEGGVKNRAGLYIMVLITVLNSCDASTEAKRAREEAQRSADALSAVVKRINWHLDRLDMRGPNQ